MTDQVRENFSRNLRILRKTHDETLADLAKAIYVSLNTIYNYEQGIALPRLDTVVLIAEHYNVQVDALVRND